MPRRVLGFSDLLIASHSDRTQEPPMADETRIDAPTLPVLPLTTGVVLPQMVITLALETDEARAAADAAADGTGGELLLVPKDARGRYAKVGTVARIENRGTLPGGTQALV